MKKLVVLVLLIALLMTTFVACAPKEAVGYDIAMITDSGEIDDKSFNQGTWEGIIEFAEANDKTYKYYKPTEVSDDAYLSAIDLAVKGGAQIVVTPGYLFEAAVFSAQDKYPETSFIILDGTPHSADYSEFRIEKNVYSIFYAEHEAGFLAGYAAVKEGYTKLGFMGGMAVPAVIRFGYGFIQGVEYAAAEMGVDAIDLKYHYTGDFQATPKNQTTAASWYADGTEIIFAAGGKVFNSVAAAAESASTKVIGVDIDQSPESETVITSAMKDLTTSVQAGLASFFDGNFKGGESEVFDITMQGVGLPMATSRFETFSQADYDAIAGELLAGSISILADSDVDSPEAVPTEIVMVTVVE